MNLSKYGNQFHVGIITHSQSKIKPTRILQAWGTSFLNHWASDKIHFISDKTINQILPIHTVVFDPDRNKKKTLTYQLIKKDILSIQYYLLTSTAGWYLRTTDNAVLFSENLDRFLLYLKRKYNPFVDRVILGNCFGFKVPLLQGGAGYFYSRAAAEFLYENRDNFIDEDIFWAEDVHFSIWVDKHLDITFDDMASEFFMGQFTENPQAAIVFNKTWNLLPRCPPRSNEVDLVSKASKFCKPFVAPFNHIVVFHELSEITNAFRRKFDQFPNVPHTPDNVYWYQGPIYAEFCLKQP